MPIKQHPSNPTPSGGGGAGGTSDSAAIHDDTAGEIAAVAEKATPVNADLILIEDSADANAKKRAQLGNLPGGGGGETNTGSNQGTDGVGVYDTKSGVDLQFRNVAPGSAKVSVTLNGKDIDIDVPGIEAGATADQSDAEIETAYNNQVSVVSQAEAEAGTATTVRRWTAERVKQAIAALGGGGGGSVVLGHSGAASTVAKGATSFVGLGSGGVTGTRANAEFYSPVAGTLQNLRTYVSANATGAAGNTVTVYVNGIASSVQTTYGSGVTGLQSDTSNTVSVSAGDQIAIEVVNTGSGGGTKDLVLESVSLEIA